MNSFAKCRTARIETEMVLVLLAQLMISGKVMGKSKNHVGKTVRQKLGINSDFKDFLKELRFRHMFEFKHNWNKVLPSQSSSKSTVTGSHS